MNDTTRSTAPALEAATLAAQIAARAPGAPGEAEQIEALKDALARWDEDDGEGRGGQGVTDVEIASHPLHTTVRLRIGRSGSGQDDDPEARAFAQALADAATEAAAGVIEKDATRAEREQRLETLRAIERARGLIEREGFEAIVDELRWREGLARGRAERAHHPEDAAVLEALVRGAGEEAPRTGARIEAGRIARALVHPQAWEGRVYAGAGWRVLEHVMADGIARWCAGHPREAREMAAAVTLDDMITLWWKQKWGRMRWEVSTPDWVHPKLWVAMRDLESDLEALSATMCESCGRASSVGWPLEADGRLAGYVTTQCEACDRTGRLEEARETLARERADPQRGSRATSRAEVEVDIEEARACKGRGAAREVPAREAVDPALLKRVQAIIDERKWGRKAADADEADAFNAWRWGGLGAGAQAGPPAAQRMRVTGARALTAQWTAEVEATGPWEALEAACAAQGGNGLAWATSVEDAEGAVLWSQAMEEAYGESAACEARRDALDEQAKDRVRAQRAALRAGTAFEDD